MSQIEAAGATIRGGMTGRTDAWRIVGPPGEGCVAIVVDAPGADAAELAEKVGAALKGAGADALAGAIESSMPSGDAAAAAIAAVRCWRDRIEFATRGDISILRFREGEVHQVNARQPRFIEREYDAALGKVDWREVLESDARFGGEDSAHTGPAIRSVERRAEGGDVYLIATDGLDPVGHELLRRLVCEGDAATPERLATLAVEAAEAYGRAFQGGRHDNATVVAVRYAPADAAAEPRKRRGRSGSLQLAPLALAVLAGVVIGAGASPFVVGALRPKAVVASGETGTREENASAEAAAPEPAKPAAEAQPQAGPVAGPPPAAATPQEPPTVPLPVVPPEPPPVLVPTAPEREPRLFPPLAVPRAEPAEDPRAAGPR